MEELTNMDAIEAWSGVEAEVVAGFGEEGDVTRRYLLNPVIFELVGDVRGKKVLDAGCGQGYLARLLTKRGAEVTGVEPAEPWYRYAVQREQDERLGIKYVQADLARWGGPVESFDVVIANMVLMDIPDYRGALRTCVAALKLGGRLIFSLLHPCFEESGAVWREKGYVEVREYFAERVVKQSFGHFIHRPLSTYINDVIEEGCTIQKVVEPQLDEAVERQYGAERYWYVPGYVVVCAVKSSRRIF